MNLPAPSTPELGIVTGNEWVIDAFDCDPSKLRDLNVVRGICDRVIAGLGVCVVGQPQVHQFPTPGGITAIYLLSESHLACHTYPEFELATFNLYCCRHRDHWPWQEELRQHLGADEVQVKQIPRGNRSKA